MQHLLRPLDWQLSPPMWYQPAPPMDYYLPPPPPPQTYTARNYLPQQSCVPSHLQLWQPPQAAFTFSLPHSTFPRYPGSVPDKLSVPELEPSSTPSEPGSPMSTLAPPTPPVAHVICNVPLRAPKPLLYRPPAFLNSFELPDPDADLSRPPYTSAAGSKRKRSDEALQNEPTDIDDRSSGYNSKRRATEHAVRGRLPTASLNGVFSARRFSC
ncbi:hypothetical protein PENSPDRAFT_748200 [Peniophora sp. CONT]|nr:hypothetical protein PENSPDRAFT_748200 [Peniophora sp. CONT]